MTANPKLLIGDVTVKNPSELGALIRKVRKSQKLTQRDMAGLSNSGNRLIVDVENGKPTVQLQKVFGLLELLGLAMTISVRAGENPAIADRAIAQRMPVVRSSEEAQANRAMKLDQDSSNLIADDPAVAERDAQIAKAFAARVAGLAKLSEGNGVAQTFGGLAEAALAAAGGQAQKVEWVTVEQATIVQSLATHGQRAGVVLNTLCAHSPGAVTKDRQLAISKRIVEEFIRLAKTKANSADSAPKL